jgi:hypothetical protein
LLTIKTVDLFVLKYTAHLRIVPRHPASSQSSSYNIYAQLHVVVCWDVTLYFEITISWGNLLHPSFFCSEDGGSMVL